MAPRIDEMLQNLGDPLDWTVDQVVAYLCHNHSPPPWSHSSTPAPLPDPATLEASLRDNFINGETLLNDIDQNTLREDLGLKAVGHRGTILRAVGYLRKASAKYQRTNLSRNPAFEDHACAFSPGYISSGASVCAKESPGRPSHLPPSGTPAPQPRAPAPVAPGSGTHHTGTEVRTRDQLPENHSRCNGESLPSGPSKNVETKINSINKDTTRSGELVLPLHSEGEVATSNSTPRLRPKEHYFVDEHGRKRRRLDLTSRADAAAGNVSTNKSHQSPELAQSKKWYMGPNRLSPDDVFYPILPDDENEDSFTIVSTGIPTAQQLFVKDCLHHFYQQQPVNLSSDKGNEKWAIIPYKNSMIESGKPQFFTLYSSRNRKVAVTQERVSQWPQLGGEEGSDPLSSTRSLKARDPYDYLIEKYPVNEGDGDVHPLYGDSGSEGEYDLDTWREIEEERQEAAQGKSRYLTPNEVDSVIAQCVKDYKEKWRKEQLPREEKKARRIWIMAKKNRSRNQQTKAMLRDIGLLEQRLKRIQKEIRLNDYVKVPDLQFQCQSMEQTIFNIEAQKWRISVLEQDKCPPRVPSVPRQRAVPKTVSYPEDEESLHSESDGLSDDSLDDFIDYDSDNSRVASHDDGSMEIDEVQERAHPSTSSNTQPDSSSDSDENIISPSGKRRKLRQKSQDEGRTLDQTPNSSARKQGFRSDQPPSSTITIRGQEIECIDLTRSSPARDMEEFEIATPPLNPVRPSDEKLNQPPMKIERLSSSPSPLFSEELRDHETLSVVSKNDNGKAHKKSTFPDVSDFKGISRISWDTLEERQDRQRLLTKLILSLPDEERDKMAEYIPRYNVSDLRKRVREALDRMLNHAQKIRSLGVTENQILMRTASLYISWVNCVRLTQQGIPKNHLRNAIADEGSFDTFASQLSSRLSEYYNTLGDKAGTRKKSPVDDNIPADGSDNLQEGSSHTPHKKRKRQVKESQEVKRNLENAQRRVALQEEQRKRLARKMSSLGVSNDDPEHQAVTFENPIIYLDSHIGQRVKPHQLEGIQFMWRELIQDEKRQGCLLAHTMGLGKTMQV